jgi:hypothetical protein
MEGFTTQKYAYKKVSLDAYALSYKYGTHFAYNAHVNYVSFCTFKAKLFFTIFSIQTNWKTLKLCALLLKFVCIEKINSILNVDKRLLTREAYWAAQLHTLRPYGI